VLNGKSDKRSQKGRHEELVKFDPSPKNSPDLAFVVQFRASIESESAGFAGRAEHVMSGQNTDFETPQELVDFFGRVMDRIKPRPQKGTRQ